MFNHVGTIAVLLGVLASLSCSRNSSDYVNEGKALFSANKIQDAEIKFKNAIQADSRNREAHYQMGLVQLKQKKKLEAYRSFAQAVEIDPASTDSKKALLSASLDLYMADPRRPQMLFDQIQKASEELLQTNPRSVEGLKAAGYLALTGMKPVEASEYFLEARKQKAPDLMLVRGLIAAYAQNGKLEEAEKAALAALEKDKTLGMLYDELYGIYIATNRLPEAQRMFERKVVDNPKVAAYRLQLAAHHANQKNLPAMEAALKPLRENAEGKYEVGRFYMNLGRWDEAIVLLREAGADNPQLRLKVEKSILQSLAGAGKPAEAQAMAEKLVKEHPEDSELKLARASFWIESRDAVKTRSAIEDLERVQSEFREMAVYWLALGRAYRQAGDMQKAVNAFQEAGRMDGRSLEAQIAQAELSMLRGQPAQVLKQLENAPKNSRIRLLKAQAFLKTGKVPEAKAILQELVKDDPNLIEGQIQLGIVLQSENQLAEAETLYKKGLAKFRGEPRLLGALSRLYVARGQGKQAIQLIEKELPSRGLELMLVQVAIDAKEADLAIQHVWKLIQEDSKNAQLHYLMAQAFLVKQDLNAAAGALDQAIQLSPKDPVAHSVRGVVMQELKRNDEALKSFKKALELSPNDTNMMNAVAFVQAETGGNLDEAQALVQKALQSAPNSAGYLDTLGWIYLKKGMADQAVNVFEGLVKKGQSDPVLQSHLAAAKLQSGKMAQGRP